MDQLDDDEIVHGKVIILANKLLQEIQKVPTNTVMRECHSLLDQIQSGLKDLVQVSASVSVVLAFLFIFH